MSVGHDLPRRRQASADEAMCRRGEPRPQPLDEASAGGTDPESAGGTPGAAALPGGLDRIVNATGYSLSGLRLAASGEAAFRQEMIVALVLLPLAFWVGRSWEDTALLLGSLVLVLIVELLNSAIEAVVDRVSLDRHELSKRAKDLASAAVFLSLVLAAGIWLTAVWHRLA